MLVTALAVLGFRLGGTPSRPAPVAATSPVSTPSAKSTPAAAASGPTISVPAASTIPGALNALVSVVQQGQAAHLIDATAVSQLYDATSAVVRAVSRGNGHSAPGKVRELADLVDHLATTNHLASAAVGPLNAAIGQLSQLVGQGD